MNIYILKCVSNAEEYIQIKGDVSKLRVPVLKSEVHFLSEEVVQFEISDQGGLEVPDILYYEGIYLVSNRVKELMDRNKANYIFWKRADLQNKKLGMYEVFWIIVPPRIDCINIDKSDIEYSEWDYADGIIPMFSYTSLQIVPKLIGRYEIFKILGIMDNNIYVTEGMYEQLKTPNFDGVEFIKLQ